ncbi:N-acetylmuramoyl-L-alanine amidase [Rossellomorea sp. AcN35-11]|nr:N-acetylmuramoyl-L-alanine amidase [Rossellomorea aquimaris]WJV30873.1 N-acetylmuramoyl-L-alanine amidase [Rossellomorea sp. AcN35-11]
MMYVVLRDAGHGLETAGKRTPYISSLGRAIKENEFNEPVSEYFGEELKRHGVIVHDISPTTNDVPLKTRTDEANRLLNFYLNKYGSSNVKIVLVSFHFNAFDGSFSGSNPSGISVHIQPGKKSARELANSVGKYLKQGTKQVWRGIIEQNLHITREFEGVAILTENGFMDHPDEAKLMLDKDFQKEVARETAQGVLEYFNLPYLPEAPKPIDDKKEEDDLLEVAIVIGTFNDYPATELLANRLKCPIYPRNAINGKVAKELIVCGGKKEGLIADKIVVLSGADRYDTYKNIEEYLKQL